MATISRSDRHSRGLLHSSQLRYASAYVLITSVVLLFLNIYAPITIRNLTYSAQKSAILDKAQLIVSAFSSYDKLDEEVVGEAIQSVNDLHTARVVVTDAGAKCLYDSLEEGSARGKLVLYPELAEALEGSDAVYIRYTETELVSRAAMPIVAYNRIVGAVYLLERDQDQALLISSLQRNILRISVGLEAAVILFSLLFAFLFSRRMAKLFDSVRQMHGGNYDQRVPEQGGDEVARLGAAFNELGQRLKQSEAVRKQFVSDRLTRLSSKLLELTRLDTQPPQERELISVLPVADRVLRMLTPVARKQQIRLELDCPAGCSMLCAADDLYQILFNLVENGIKYNSPQGFVRLEARADEENVQILVEDDGVGIPDSEKAHIFERFYRVDKARSRKAGGAGLGLSIVQDMVTRNDGTIQVEDRPEGGSRFRLSFPYFAMPEEETP